MRRRGEAEKRHRLDRFGTEAGPLAQQSPLPCPEALFESEGIGPGKAAMGEQRADRHFVKRCDSMPGFVSPSRRSAALSSWPSVGRRLERADRRQKTLV